MFVTSSTANPFSTVNFYVFIVYEAIVLVMTLKLTSESKLHNFIKVLNMIPSTPLSLFFNSCNSPESFHRLCLLHQF